MITIVNAAKASFLVAALAIVGSAVFSGSGYARETFCEDPGHSCHVTIGEETYHLIKVE